MARRYIRPRLTDQAGNVLEGALLRVLEAGTSTTVDLYAASAGGSALSQPRSTDARGEVEVWLADGTGDIDLEWSADPGVTTVAASGRTTTFSTFTEFVEAPSGGSGASTHAGLPDLATSGHPAGVITGLGGAAVLDVGTGAGTVAAGDDGRFLPPDPAAPLAAVPSFDVSSTAGNATQLVIGAHAAATMANGLGSYVTEVAVDAGFATVVATLTRTATVFQFVVNALAVPPLYFRVKAVDCYGNESPWLEATGNPLTVTKLTPASLDTTGYVIPAAPADPADDGKVLTAGSGAASWVAPAGGASPIDGPTFLSGRYAGWSGAIDTRSTNEDRGFYVPMPIPRSVTIDRIGIEVTDSAAGSPVIRLGIYENNAGAPGTLILDAGTVDASTTGFKEITISQALTAGMVWLVLAQQGGTSNGSVRATRYATHVSIPSSGYSLYEAAAWVDADATSGALGASAPAMNDVVSAAPRFMLRVV